MPIWIIRHVKYKRLGNLPGILKELGIPFRSISISEGDPLPELKQVRGIISMGGPMSAYEKTKYPWIKKEEEFMRRANKKGIPILGICLGGQILAQAFGAKVRKAPKAEAGWFRLSGSTAKKDPILKGLRLPLLFELHYDAFDVPKEAVNLLKSAQNPHQMFRIGKNTFGIQFHPEVDETMARSVAEEYRKNLSQKEQRAILDNLEKNTAKGREFCVQFIKRIFS